jgi:hypothetical protein
MQFDDIRECVDMVANHPVIGPRYGPMLELLPQAWLRLLQYEAKFAFVAQDGESSHARICLFGISIFVHDDFLREMKAPPHFWVGPELTRRIINGESPLLTAKQLREENSRNGLNLVGWEACVHPEYEPHGEAQRYLMSVFIQNHRGYRWKEVIAVQCDIAGKLDYVLRTGGYIWDSVANGYTTTLRSDPSEIVSGPHVLGITRDLELKRQGDWGASWIGALFDYHPPVLGLNQTQQCLLSHALQGVTDEKLAAILETSIPSIKKQWISIYLRLKDRLPELVPDPLEENGSSNGRGKEKRRRLLGYLREHPEELRPVVRVRPHKSTIPRQRVADRPLE